MIIFIINILTTWYINIFFADIVCFNIVIISSNIDNTWVTIRSIKEKIKEIINFKKIKQIKNNINYKKMNKQLFLYNKNPNTTKQKQKKTTNSTCQTEW